MGSNRVYTMRVRGEANIRDTVLVCQLKTHSVLFCRFSAPQNSAEFCRNSGFPLVLDNWRVRYSLNQWYTWQVHYGEYRKPEHWTSRSESRLRPHTRGTYWYNIDYLNTLSMSDLEKTTSHGAIVRWKSSPLEGNEHFSWAPDSAMIWTSGKLLSGLNLLTSIISQVGLLVINRQKRFMH